MKRLLGTAIPDRRSGLDDPVLLPVRLLFKGVRRGADQSVLHGRVGSRYLAGGVLDDMGQLVTEPAVAFRRTGFVRTGGEVDVRPNREGFRADRAYRLIRRCPAVDPDVVKRLAERLLEGGPMGIRQRNTGVGGHHWVGVVGVGVVGFGRPVAARSSATTAALPTWRWSSRMRACSGRKSASPGSPASVSLAGSGVRSSRVTS
jgi:hypothetical protein